MRKNMQQLRKVVGDSDTVCLLGDSGNYIETTLHDLAKALLQAGCWNDLLVAKNEQDHDDAPQKQGSGGPDS